MKFKPHDRVELARKLVVRKRRSKDATTLVVGERGTVLGATLRIKRKKKGWSCRWLVRLDDDGQRYYLRGKRLRRCRRGEDAPPHEADGFRVGDRVTDDTRRGVVISVHPHKRNRDLAGSAGINVRFDNGSECQFASYLVKHADPVEALASLA